MAVDEPELHPIGKATCYSRFCCYWTYRQSPQGLARAIHQRSHTVRSHDTSYKADNRLLERPNGKGPGSSPGPFLVLGRPCDDQYEREVVVVVVAEPVEVGTVVVVVSRLAR
jgi:hypothetical protein